MLTIASGHRGGMNSPWASYGPSAPAPPPSGSERGNKRANARQLLSCTKCRERKVKCDRTQPCAACCARGHPKECEFVVGEGNDYPAIRQSYEIRALRDDNEKLKRKLEAAGLPYSEDEDDDEGSFDRKSTASKATASRQRRFKAGNSIDNLYFGTPGLANVVSDFANLQLGGQSLTHPMPKGRDIYGVEPSTFPFGIVARFLTIESLVDLLRCYPREELFACLDLFHQRAQPCSFPHTHHEITKREVERFLADAEFNANQCPEMLALLFTALATGLQMSQYDPSREEWVEGAAEITRKKGDAFIAASMQTLRLTSFMSRPTLLSVQTLVMMGPYLTNSGRFLDAWTLFGSTIRMAQSIGLHRDPKLLDPTPPLRECTVRRALWWWMLHMDQQYSVTLGRPLGISGVGDCQPLPPLTTDPNMLRLSELVDHFTLLARQILGSSEMMSLSTVDGYTDKLIALWDTMPQALRFDETWAQDWTPLPEWPLGVMSATLFAKVQSFLILLNRQRVERSQSSQGDGSPSKNATMHSRADWATTQASIFADSSADRPLQRGRPLVIRSCIQLLQVFLFFYQRNKAVLICWMLGQQAFNASMILLLDALETGNDESVKWCNQAFVVFSVLNENHVHKLARLAVQRISHGLSIYESRKAERKQQLDMSRRARETHQQMQQPGLQLDTATMMDFANDTVMGNNGMILLEDPGLQFHSTMTSTFSPLDWIMPGSAHPSFPSHPPTPTIPSPIVPGSQITAPPFPTLSTIPATNSPYAVGLQPRMPSTHRRIHPSRHRQHSHGLAQSALTDPGFTPINTNLPDDGSQSRRLRQANEAIQQQQAPQAPMMVNVPQEYAVFGHTASPPQQYMRPPASTSQQQTFSPHHCVRQSHARGRSSSERHSTSAGSRGSHRLDKPPRSHQRRK